MSASEPKTIEPGKRALLRVDLQMAIPKGYYGNLVGRSGLANSHGAVAFPGTIDSDYTGVVCVILFNLSDVAYPVKRGYHIAQVIIRKCYNVHFVECEEAEFEKFWDTERGTDGFGSSLCF